MDERNLWKLSSDFSCDVMNMNRLFVDDSTTSRKAATQRVGPIHQRRHWAAVRCCFEYFTFCAENQSVARITQPRRILSNSVQHRLNICWRTRNDAQNFTRRRLLLQRFLEFVEQPDIFERDDSLISESFKQLDLCRGEGAHLGATCEQASNEFPFEVKRSRQQAAKSAGKTESWKFILSGLHIGNVEGSTFANPAILWPINTDLFAASRY